jgi:hypothetical protein
MRDASSGDKLKITLFGELSVWKRLWTCRETDKYLILEVNMPIIVFPPSAEVSLMKSSHLERILENGIA